MKHLLLVLLVCRIFSWGPEGPNGVTPEINKWLQGKKVVSIFQSGAGSNALNMQTYLTIIAEEA